MLSLGFCLDTPHPLHGFMQIPCQPELYALEFCRPMWFGCILLFSTLFLCRAGAFIGLVCPNVGLLIWGHHPLIDTAAHCMGCLGLRCLGLPGLAALFLFAQLRGTCQLFALQPGYRQLHLALHALGQTLELAPHQIIALASPAHHA